MPILGTPRKFYTKFKFLVEIDGIGSAAFSACSELSAEVAKIEHYEGGVAIPDKTPGRVTFADVTLERGATEDLDIFLWFKDVIDASAAGPSGADIGVGLADAGYKRDLAIIQLDRDGSRLRTWNVFGAWPVKIMAGEWDNNSDENLIESVTLTYDRFDTNS